jgi:hypothetical protein
MGPAIPGNEFTTPAVYSFSLTPGLYVLGFEVFNYRSLNGGNYTGVNYYASIARLAIRPRRRRKLVLPRFF